MRKLLIALSLGVTLLLSACGGSSVNAKEQCARLFVTSIAQYNGTTHNANGVYACLSKDSRADFFLRLGWTNDARIQQWENDHFAQAFQVETFADNPTQITLGSGTTAKTYSAYLYRLNPYYLDGTVNFEGGNGFTFVVDSAGKVIVVQ